MRGPALPVTVTVHDGCLFVLISGKGPGAQVCPTHRLYEVQTAALLELAWHLDHHLALHIEEHFVGHAQASTSLGAYRQVLQSAACEQVVA